MSEAPIHPLMRDTGKPEWEQIVGLFKSHGATDLPWRLRDDLVNILVWARYGEALTASVPPVEGVGTEERGTVCPHGVRWPWECHDCAALTVGTEPKTDAWRKALEEIRDRHIPDQPASYGGSEYDWAVRQHSALRDVARVALIKKGAQ